MNDHFSRYARQILLEIKQLKLLLVSCTNNILYTEFPAKIQCDKGVEGDTKLVQTSGDDEDGKYPISSYGKPHVGVVQPYNTVR